MKQPQFIGGAWEKKNLTKRPFLIFLMTKSWHTHIHTCITFTSHASVYKKLGAQVFLLSAALLCKFVSQTSFFFLSTLSGILTRACIDGSSGKRHFISCGQTNSDVNACSIPSKSNSIFYLSMYSVCHIFIKWILYELKNTVCCFFAHFNS